MALCVSSDVLHGPVNSARRLVWVPSPLPWHLQGRGGPSDDRISGPIRTWSETGCVTRGTRRRCCHPDTHQAMGARGLGTTCSHTSDGSPGIVQVDPALSGCWNQNQGVGQTAQGLSTRLQAMLVNVKALAGQSLDGLRRSRSASSAVDKPPEGSYLGCEDGLCMFGSTPIYLELLQGSLSVCRRWSITADPESRCILHTRRGKILLCQIKLQACEQSLDVSEVGCVYTITSCFPTWRHSGDDAYLAR